MPMLGNVEYIANEQGIATHVKCPLVDRFIEDIDCIENHDIACRLFKEECLPDEYKQNTNWRTICTNCPFGNY